MLAHAQKPKAKVKSQQNRNCITPQHLENNNTPYAYSSIDNFFDVFAVNHALKYTDSMFHAATGPKVWKKESPDNLLFYIEKLRELCTAAFTIHYSDLQRKAAIVPGQESGTPDMALTANFMDRHDTESVWNNFPRHLSAKQYHNPYRAVKKCCTYMAEQEWNKFLNDITQYALSKSSIDVICHSYNILAIRLRLLQLIEACHLLHVRTKPINPQQPG